MSHTPGPWMVSGPLGGLNPFKDGYFEINTGPGVLRHAAAQAFEDARLIAAAPDLLERLTDLVALIERDAKLSPGSDLATSVRISRATLAKARGAK